MVYIVNDIENLAQLNLLGALGPITSACSSISVTNIRVDGWSDFKQKIWLRTFEEHNVNLIEVDFEFYSFSQANKGKLLGISDGDKSSIFQCLNDGAILVTSNSLIRSYANYFSIETIDFTEFLKYFIKDHIIINTFNQIKAV